MRFISTIAIAFFLGAALLAKGYHEDAVTLFILIAICISSEAYRPEKETIKAAMWSMENLKRLCVPLLILSTI